MLSNGTVALLLSPFVREARDSKTVVNALFAKIIALQPHRACGVVVKHSHLVGP